MAKAIRISTAAANASLNALSTLVDVGTAAYVALLDSTDVVLGRVILNDPSFAAASGGAKALDVDPAITITLDAVGNGTISKIAFQSFATPVYTTVFTGTVGTTSDYDYQITDATTSIGKTTTITGFTLTQPLAA